MTGKWIPSFDAFNITFCHVVKYYIINIANGRVLMTSIRTKHPPGKGFPLKGFLWFSRSTYCFARSRIVLQFYKQSHAVQRLDGKLVCKQNLSKVITGNDIFYIIDSYIFLSPCINRCLFKRINPRQYRTTDVGQPAVFRVGKYCYVFHYMQLYVVVGKYW